MPKPRALHVVVLGVEATGRMLVGDFLGGNGASGEIVASAATLRQELDALLAQNPELVELRLFVPERLGLSAERLAEWVAGRPAVPVPHRLKQPV